MVWDRILYDDLFQANLNGLLTALQNVHEGPIGVGTRVQYTEVALSAGNVISDGIFSPMNQET